MVDTVRLTQQYVEVVSSGDPSTAKVRATQQYLEVIHGPSSHVGEASFSGLGSLSADALLTQAGAAAFSGDGSLSADAIRVSPPLAAATLQGSGTLSANAKERLAASARYAGNSTVRNTNTLRLFEVAAARFAGAGSLTASYDRRFFISARLPGAGSLQASANVGFTASSIFAGAGSLSSRLRIPHAGSAIFSGTGLAQWSANVFHPGTTFQLSGFVNVNHFGNTAFVPESVEFTLSGFADPDLFGQIVWQFKKHQGQGGGNQPGGVAKGQKYGTPITMPETGRIIALSCNANTAKTVNTRMALYSQSGSLPANLLDQSAVQTTCIVGENVYPLINGVVAAAGTTFWPALHSDGNFNWFLEPGPQSRLNADAFNDGPSDPYGASTVQNNKAPIFLIYLEPVDLNWTMTGFANVNQFGTTMFGGLQQFSLGGFDNANAFGTTTFIGSQPFTLTGFASTNQFGTLEFAKPAAKTITLTGFADADAFGTITFNPSTTIELTGFADGDAFGSQTWTQPDQSMNLTGFADGDLFGAITFVLGEAPPFEIAEEILDYYHVPARSAEYKKNEPVRLIEDTSIRDL